MANASELNYETIDNGYNSLVERGEGVLGEPGMVNMGGVGDATQQAIDTAVKDAAADQGTPIQGSDLENLWISSWIKSRSYLPGQRGFLIDGKLGYIECGDLRVRGKGEIGGWNIDATRIYSDSNEIVLDSVNKRIEVGADDAIVLDGVNKRITVGVSAPITIDGVNKRIRSDNYSTGVSGFSISPTLIEAENLIARGTMRGSVFAYDTINAIGGQVIVSNADSLASDMTALDASLMTVKGDSIFAVNDILVMRGVATSGIQEEWFRVTNIASAPTYTVTRDLAGAHTADNNPIWKAGTPVVKQGVSNGVDTFSGGWLRLIGEGTNSPYYSVFNRTGIAYNNYAEVARLGNLNGYPGYTTDLYGIGIGDSTHYLKYDPTNHLRIAGAITASTIYIPDATNPLFSVDILGNVKVKSLERDDFHWFTVFESIDGYGKSITGTGQIVLNDNLVDIRTGDVAGNYTEIQKTALDAIPARFTWNKDRKIKCQVRFIDVSAQTIFITCGCGQNATDNKIGFVISNNSLSGVVANGSAQSTTNPITISTTFSEILEVKFIAGTSASFYVNDILIGTITTNLPTGSDIAGWLLDIVCTTNTNAVKGLQVSYWDFWQAN